MINCPDCGISIEFWKDDPKRKCPDCDTVVVNPKLDISCAKWCKYAKECLGESSTDDTSILCKLFIEEMKKALSHDQTQINHALEVLKYADQIQQIEGGNPLVVKAAAIFLDLGMYTPDKQNSADGGPQKTEGAILVKNILIKLGVDTESLEQIYQIITRFYNADEINTIEFRIVWDAEQLTNLSSLLPCSDKEDTKQSILHIFKTHQGRQLANEWISSRVMNIR